MKLPKLIINYDLIPSHKKELIRLFNDYKDFISLFNEYHGTPDEYESRRALLDSRTKLKQFEIYLSNFFCKTNKRIFEIE